MRIEIACGDFRRLCEIPLAGIDDFHLIRARGNFHRPCAVRARRRGIFAHRNADAAHSRIAG